MDSDFANICESMDGFKVLTKFKLGIVIRCHLCNKAVCENSSLDIPQNLNHTDSDHVRGESCQTSLYWLTAEFQTPSRINISTKTVRQELRGMGFYG